MAYIPNKAIHPGLILAESIAREGMTQKNLSERTGISEKHLSQIINGEASLTVDTALALENALGGSASFWLNLEKNYQETKGRFERSAILGREVNLLSKYPYNELVQRGYVEPTPNKEKRVEHLWKFFAVNSLAFIPTTESIAFRRRMGSSPKSEAIAAWLRCGEVEARKQHVSDYSESRLRETLPQMKLLSVKEPSQFSREIVSLLNEAGVALAFIAHFPGTGVSGAVRWVNKTPVIQLSLYYSWADIFWFNLYHEIGHLLLHGKKERFIEYERRTLGPSSDTQEIEADQFACNELIAPKEYSELVKTGPISRARIIEFAKRLGIHPGIVAGRLCHDGKVDWKTVASMRSRLTLEPDHA